MKKYILWLIPVLVITLLFFYKVQASQDVIGIRVLPNPDHYSVLRWYENQGFTGSPQSMLIDGYRAIRDGRTVYINTANVSEGRLYTNIYLISYNQDTQPGTTDIFGKILSNWKFNTNINNRGTCSISSLNCQSDDDCNNGYICSESENKCVLEEVSQCLSDSQCPSGLFCDSDKAKLIRDTKRLSDLSELKVYLENYKNKFNRNHYPKLTSGTYIPGSTVSTWPSWQYELASTLDLNNLPVDPINTIGKCDGNFDPVTCWNSDDKEFYGNITGMDFPVNSRLYFYYTADLGQTANFCTFIEGNYSNIPPLSCVFNITTNFAPVITHADMTAYPNEEFSKYISVTDLNNDSLNWSLNTSNVDWTNYGWSAPPVLKDTEHDRQTQLYAEQAGEIGDYPLTIRVEDDRGLYDEKILNISIRNLNLIDYISIGESKEYYVNGRNLGSNSNFDINLRNASYNSTSISLEQLNNYGFTFDSNNFLLKENFTPAQHTGEYEINLYALNNNSGEKTDSSFDLTIENNPPYVEEVEAVYSNGDTESCIHSDQCVFIIDNAEEATLQVIAEDDNPGHILSYSLENNLDGAISINSNIGIISGLNNLNYHETEIAEFDFQVRISDQYCANSTEESCSTYKDIKVVVQEYCSVNTPETLLSTNPIEESPVTVNTSGQTINIGNEAIDCSDIGNSSVDIKYIGDANSKVIIFVMDYSKSMDTLINGIPAIDRAKAALTDDNDGVLKTIHETALELPEEHSIEVGLVIYNTNVHSYGPLDISQESNLQQLKSNILNYNTYYQTKTLDALNEAENLLDSPEYSDINKSIILMSDGYPGVDQRVISGGECYPDCEDPECDPCPEGTYRSGTHCTCECVPRTCWCQGEYPDCSTPVCGPCPDGEKRINYCTCECAAPTCLCGGTYPNCTWPTGCECGRSGCSCRTNCGSVYNDLEEDNIDNYNDLDFKMAITEQTQCLDTNTPCEEGCSSNQRCRGFDVEQNYNCDTSDDVLTQANYLKNNGVQISAIYYDTTDESGPAQKMCEWSSNNGVDCDNETYFYAGTDINKLFDDVLVNIVNKPKAVEIAEFELEDSNPHQLESFLEGVNIDDALNCGYPNLAVEYTDTGYLEFSNLSYDYCPAKLHQ
ncbi:VWA domain-containing protein [Patescibacteria group bacterium]|nr:VWA domain-containing protein [Patescibacteria group bacterium]